MKDTIFRLQQLIDQGNSGISSISPQEMSLKLNPAKWSKKEILGHLIDSALNNIRRFTEIHFESRPYNVHPYKQDELVAANNYQNANVAELLGLWNSLNQRIIQLMLNETEETLLYEVHIDNLILDLRFLMEDYVKHLEHHLKQILGEF